MDKKGILGDKRKVGWGEGDENFSNQIRRS
jgi:hypothetical protein